MDSVAVTIPPMSKPRKGGKGKPEKPQGRSPSHPVFVRIKPELGVVLDRYVDESRPQTSVKAVIEYALEQYFSSIGLWPPEDPPAD